MPDRPIAEQLVEALTVIEALRAENLALQDKVAALEAALAQDSSRSSKPPSGDPVGARKKRAERRRRPGPRRSGRRASSQGRPAPTWPDAPPT